MVARAATMRAVQRPEEEAGSSTGAATMRVVQRPEEEAAGNGTAPGPLAGVKVIELGGIGPGPHARTVLADLGADMVRVRRPGGLTMPTEDRDLVHRGKRIIDLDVKTHPQVLLDGGPRHQLAVANRGASGAGPPRPAAAEPGRRLRRRFVARAAGHCCRTR